MESSRQEYCSGAPVLPFPSPGDLPTPGIKRGFPVLQADSLPSEPPVASKALHPLSSDWTLASSCSIFLFAIVLHIHQPSARFKLPSGYSALDLSISNSLHLEQLTLRFSLGWIILAFQLSSSRVTPLHFFPSSLVSIWNDYTHLCVFFYMFVSYSKRWAPHAQGPYLILPWSFDLEQNL